MADLVKARELMEAVVTLVRAFGLHRPDRMPSGGRPISVAEVHALMDMHAAGPISQRDLAAGLCLEKSTVSRLVRLMEGRGWVRRTTAEHDRRVMHVSLSEAGRTAAQHLARVRGAKFARVLAAIPQDQRVSVVEAVSALVMAARDLSARKPASGIGFSRSRGPEI
ncbi:MAG: MarR family transcriptional regulator [Verrucomicrobia bacterium]|nr:MarR family transcriptional regulator [Verrucomicrobiota bacterium]